MNPIALLISVCILSPVDRPAHQGSAHSPTTLHSPPSDNPLKNRERDKRDQALERFGGSRKTQRAVADGLGWLAAHQRSDGIWDRRRFDRICPEHDRCSQTALTHLDRDADVGMSALAALAFLGAGYTHVDGPYAEHLSRAFSYILAQQDIEGGFSAGSGFQMYNDAIATIAIAEASALTKDPVFEQPLRLAVAHLARAQQPTGGWDYADDPKTGRSDTSITGWVVMAIKSAQAAGVAAPVSTRFRMLKHFENATEPGGRVWYADKPARAKPGARPYKRRYGPAMVATALFARSAFGFQLDDRVSKTQIEKLLRDLPNLNKLRQRDAPGLHSEYYWYYGTLAMFNLGGDAWKQWNLALRTAVLEYQERPVRKDGSKRHGYGSWPAYGPGWGRWGRTGSRIYATAINTLTLEAYYRYVPAYLSLRGIIGPAELRQRLAAIGPPGHPRILRLAKRLHPDNGEPALVELLGSPNEDVAVEAAVALAEIGSPRGRKILQYRKDNADPATPVGRAWKRITEPPPERTYGAVAEINSQAGMFLFETGGQPLYYGQRVGIVRDDRVIGTARVNRRFSPQKSAVAKIEASDEPIVAGDIIVTLRTR